VKGPPDQMMAKHWCHLFLAAYRRDVLWPSKYAKMHFRTGLCPGSRWGSL